MLYAFIHDLFYNLSKDHVAEYEDKYNNIKI